MSEHAWFDAVAFREDPTHAGEFSVMGRTFRCFRLNTGEAIIHADDLKAFLEDASGAEAAP